VKILVVEDADDAIGVVIIFDFDLADKHRAMEVDDVIAIQRHLQRLVFHLHAGGERVAQISLGNVPRPVIAPRKLPVLLPGHLRENAEPTRPVAGVIFLTDVREVDVAQLVALVEGDQETAVTDWDVTWHSNNPAKALKYASSRPKKPQAREPTRR